MAEKKSRKEKFQIVKNVLSLFIPIIWREKKIIILYKAVMVLTKTLQPFVPALMSKYLINELTGSRDLKTIILYIVFFSSLTMILGMITGIMSQGVERCKDYLDNKCSELFMKKQLELDFEHTEDPDILKQITKAREGISWYSGGPVMVLNIAENILVGIFQLIGASTLFILGFPILFVIIGITVLFLSFINRYLANINLEYYLKLSTMNHSFGYYLFNITQFDFAKDIRLFGAANMFFKKVKAITKQQSIHWHGRAKARMKPSSFTVTVESVSDFFVFFSLGVGVFKKIISIGDFPMFTSLCYTFKSALQSIIFNVQDLYTRGSYANETVKFFSLPNLKNSGTKKLPIKDSYDIEFKNVSFKYPRTDNYVLKDINIKIRGGDHLSVVGLNGAGKTTFIKLLCRFYDATEGTITLDNVDIKEYDYDEYVKALSVVFQDIILFAFTVAENISAGLDEDIDKDKLDKVIKLSDLSGTMEGLKFGADTFINKSFDENGTEFSGGQRQKIAIARALYKDAPIVILDEPTAALDPIAEYEIYNQFNSLVGGKTAIYISHRLSSCKFCDNIAVFSENTIKEFGTHDELVNLENGVYAEMYKAQAQYYVNY